MKSAEIHFLSALGMLCALAVIPAALRAAYPRAHERHGTIKSVDAAAHTLIVTDLKDKSEHTFQLNDQSKFTEHGKAANAADLEAGKHIRFTSKGDSDVPIIEHATLAPAKVAKPAPEEH